MTYFMDMQAEDRPSERRKFKEPIRNMITLIGEVMQKNPTSVVELVGRSYSVILILYKLHTA